MRLPSTLLALIVFSSSTVAFADEPLDLSLRPGRFALGARVRGLFITPAMVAPFLPAATTLASASLGVEFIYRKPSYDVVTSLDFSFTTPSDGNFLGVNHDPSVDTHFVHFDNLNFISADVSIIGHHWFTDWFELRYGAGVGLGVVLGDVYLINNSSSCTLANAGDISQCHPVGVDLTSPMRQQQLQATANGMLDTAQTPHYHVSADKPPVLPVLNILVGALFKVHRHVTLQVELGFRDAIFFGGGAHYWF